MWQRMGLGLLVAGLPLLWVMPLGGSLTMAVGALWCAVSSESALDRQAEARLGLAVVPVSPDSPPV